MMSRRYNTTLIKGNLTYTTEELAELLNVTPSTVRGWFGDGLSKIDDRKPFLVLGHQVKQFLKNRQEKSHIKLAPNELYCFKCKAPRTAAGNMVDYLPETETSGKLRALCNECEKLCFKSIRADVIAELGQKLDIVIEANE